MSFVYVTCLEVNWLNASSANSNPPNQSADATISSNAIFLRSSTLCYRDLRKEMGIVLARDVNLMSKPIDGFGGDAEGL